jgi:hypothetical protein
MTKESCVNGSLAAIHIIRAIMESPRGHLHTVHEKSEFASCVSHRDVLPFIVSDLLLNVRVPIGPAAPHTTVEISSPKATIDTDTESVLGVLRVWASHAKRIHLNVAEA